MWIHRINPNRITGMKKEVTIARHFFVDIDDADPELCGEKCGQIQYQHGMADPCCLAFHGSLYMPNCKGWRFKRLCACKKATEIKRGRRENAVT
jgi:hypothetical protein